MRVIIIVMVWLSMLVVSTAEAAILVEHVGANDPVTEYFYEDIAQTPPMIHWKENGQAGGSGDANEPAHWEMVKTPGPTMIGAYYTNEIQTDLFDDPCGWTISAKVKVEYSWDIGHANIIGVYDGHDWWDLHVISKGVAADGLYFRITGDLVKI